MATIKFIQKLKLTKSGKAPIYVAIYDKDDTELIYTRERIQPSFWDKANQCVRHVKNLPADASDVSSLITNIKAEVEACRAELKRKKQIEPSAYAIKAEYEKKLRKREAKERIKESASKENEKAVTVLMDKWISSLNHQPLTIKTVNDSLNTFKDFLKATFQSGIEVKELTQEIVIDYSKWLSDKRKLADSSHGKRMKHLRQFLNTLRLAFDPSKIEIKHYTKPIIHLTMIELKQLENVDVSYDRLLDKAKDMFLLGCYTALRVSDLKRITPSTIQNDEIVITTKKTGEHLTIPILPETEKILKKYKNYSPPISEPLLNFNIKKVCKEAGITSPIKITTKRGGMKIDTDYPKYKLISSHIAGKTFISLAPERWKMQPHEIAAITGKNIQTLLTHYFKKNTASAKQKMLGSENNDKMNIA